eukprot:SAG31_NODE_217_length_19988_cov_53.300820_12_plen_58_part_00
MSNSSKLKIIIASELFAKFGAIFGSAYSCVMLYAYARGSCESEETFDQTWVGSYSRS